MLKLQENFELDRYGLHVRFVNVEDSQFLIDIRTDKKNEKFIHFTSNNLNEQVKYIEHYKELERDGKEYYLMFEINGCRQGVYRIYNRNEEWCTLGSWVFSSQAEKTSAFRALIISYEIAFEDLGYSVVKDFDGVHEHNTNVIRAVKLIGAKQMSDRNCYNGKFLTWVFTKEAFYSCRKKVLHLVGVDC